MEEVAFRLSSKIDFRHGECVVQKLVGDEGRRSGGCGPCTALDYDVGELGVVFSLRGVLRVAKEAGRLDW